MPFYQEEKAHTKYTEQCRAEYETLKPYFPQHSIDDLAHLGLIGQRGDMFSPVQGQFVAINPLGKLVQCALPIERKTVWKEAVLRKVAEILGLGAGTWVLYQGGKAVQDLDITKYPSDEVVWFWLSASGMSVPPWSSPDIGGVQRSPSLASSPSYHAQAPPAARSAPPSPAYASSPSNHRPEVASMGRQVEAVAGRSPIDRAISNLSLSGNQAKQAQPTYSVEFDRSRQLLHMYRKNDRWTPSPDEQYVFIAPVDGAYVGDTFEGFVEIPYMRKKLLEMCIGTSSQNANGQTVISSLDNKHTITLDGKSILEAPQLNVTGKFKQQSLSNLIIVTVDAVPKYDMGYHH